MSIYWKRSARISMMSARNLHLVSGHGYHVRFGIGSSLNGGRRKKTYHHLDVMVLRTVHSSWKICWKKTESKEFM